jgi:hypothetical protein
MLPTKFYFQQYISYIMTTSFSGEGSRREPPTTGKQLVIFITWFGKAVSEKII